MNKFYQPLLFLFSKHLNTMSNVTDCDSGQTDLWYVLQRAESACGSFNLRLDIFMAGGSAWPAGPILSQPFWLC